MTVEELFRQLSYGELSNLAMAVDATGTIKKTQQNRVIHFANEGLRALHTRFPLIETPLLLTLTADTELVVALPDGAIKVLSILTAWGESISFTTVVQPGAFYVTGGEIHVPAMAVDTGTELQAYLQMRHPTLNPIATDADLAQVITLLPELYKALTSYIAAEMYGTMNTADAAAVAANHRARYEATCLEALSLGLIPSEIRLGQKFEARGWV